MIACLLFCVRYVQPGRHCSKTDRRVLDTTRRVAITPKTAERRREGSGGQWKAAEGSRGQQRAMLRRLVRAAVVYSDSIPTCADGGRLTSSRRNTNSSHGPRPKKQRAQPTAGGDADASSAMLVTTPEKKNGNKGRGNWSWGTGMEAGMGAGKTGRWGWGAVGLRTPSSTQQNGDGARTTAARRASLTRRKWQQPRTHGQWVGHSATSASPHALFPLIVAGLGFPTDALFPLHLRSSHAATVPNRDAVVRAAHRPRGFPSLSPPPAPTATCFPGHARLGCEAGLFQARN
jgi:hypothetical protein